MREFEPAQWGWTPHYGRVEVPARMHLSPRTMASVWMAGLEDEPQRCGEICIFEVFGEAIAGRTAAVGTGIKPFRDPALTDEFSAPLCELDVGEFHVYAADWRHFSAWCRCRPRPPPSPPTWPRMPGRCGGASWSASMSST